MLTLAYFVNNHGGVWNLCHQAVRLRMQVREALLRRRHELKLLPVLAAGLLPLSRYLLLLVVQDDLRRHLGRVLLLLRIK